MLLPVSGYLVLFFYIAVLIFLLLYFHFAVCRIRCPCPCLPIWVVLRCLYGCLSSVACRAGYFFLPYYACYMWLSFVYFTFFVFCFLVFSQESLPGDDVLCRLLPRPLTSVCFFSFLFVYIVLFSPTVFVPGLIWCNSLYLVLQLD